MSGNEPKIIEGNGTNRPVSDEIKSIQYVGLEPVTIRNSDILPFFFLFVDIDSKDIEILRSALNIAKSHRLTVYFYETCKGWHIISPCLLNIRKWSFILKQLSGLQEYSGDTIRWTPRKCDGKILHYHSWNTGRRAFDESYDLIFKLHEKFMVDMTPDKILHAVSTKLSWNLYYQTRLNLVRHY